MSTTTSGAHRLQEFAPNIWTVEGDDVDFYGFPYPTRMVVVLLTNTFTTWIWSPIALTEALVFEIEQTAGPVSCIVAPNKIHWLFLKEWQDRFPHAEIYGAPGLDQRKKLVEAGIRFKGDLGDSPEDSYATDIDQVVFKGSLMDEVVFFHRVSRTVIFCDLIQRHQEGQQSGFKGMLMRWDGVVGPNGSTPREWRFSFWWNGQQQLAREALDKILYDWMPDKLVIAHGECAQEGAADIIERSLEWIPTDPRPNPFRCDCIPKVKPEGAAETSREDRQESSRREDIPSSIL